MSRSSRPPVRRIRPSQSRPSPPLSYLPPATATDAAARTEPEDPATVACDNCEAVCCRLTVLLMAGDRVPSHYLALDDRGAEVMAQRGDGWCVALDRASMRCTIYAVRPQVCRDYATAAPECLQERAHWREQRPRQIAIALASS